MVINAVKYWLPETIISNQYFEDNFNIKSEDIVSKSGILERCKCNHGENTNTMAIEAVIGLISNMPYSVQDVDLIIGCTYTPYDTVGTLAHSVQKYFNIEGAKCFTVNSACSSFVNALEITDCFFKVRKASKALIIVSEQNSRYANYSDPKSGFLWGDGAAAILVSEENNSEKSMEVVDIQTSGLGTIGKSIDGVYLRPTNGGLKMPFGKDVFQFACNYIINDTLNILKKNKIELNKLDYFIPHQANARITDYVSKQLKLQPHKVLTNIEKLGNTGSASTPIVLSQNWDRFDKNETIVISVFGGGYSSGAILLKRL